MLGAGVVHEGRLQLRSAFVAIVAASLRRLPARHPGQGVVRPHPVAVSHGCVRLAQAAGFAKLLLANEPGWSAARVDETLASGQTVRVTLTHKVPVRLMYLTAFPEGDDRLRAGRLWRGRQPAADARPAAAGSARWQASLRSCRRGELRRVLDGQGDVERADRLVGG